MMMMVVVMKMLNILIKRNQSDFRSTNSNKANKKKPRAESTCPYWNWGNLIGWDRKSSRKYFLAFISWLSSFDWLAALWAVHPTICNTFFPRKRC